MPVGELQQRMSAREFAEWIAYYQLDPFGEERADLRVATLTALTANIYKKKGKPDFKPQDFMPFLPKEEKTPEEMLAFVELLNAALGGKDLRENDGNPG